MGASYSARKQRREKLERLMEQNKQLARPDIPEEPAEEESEGQTRRGPQQQAQDGLSKSKKQPGRVSGSKQLADRKSAGRSGKASGGSKRRAEAEEEGAAEAGTRG